MQKTDKEKVVADLVERLRTTESLIVADYRGLTNAELVGLRAKLRSSGAQLKVVKNTLTRRAAHEAGARGAARAAGGPDRDRVRRNRTAIPSPWRRRCPTPRRRPRSSPSAAGSSPAARSPAPTWRSSPSFRAPEVVKSQLVGVIVAPLTQLAALVAAPLRDLVGLIDARIEQLGTGAPADAGASGAEAAEAARRRAGGRGRRRGGSRVAEAAGDEPVAEAPQRSDAEAARRARGRGRRPRQRDDRRAAGLEAVR